MRFNRVLLAAALTASAASLAQQSPPPVLRGALETALDRNTTLVIGRHPIARALELVTQHTQVPLVISPRTTALLPYGAETQMSLTIRGIPLREGLAGMLRPVAMTFVVRNEHIEIIPTPPLRRLGRAPRRNELALLERLSTTPWSISTGPPLQYHVRVDNPSGMLHGTARTIGAGSQAEILELTCQRLGWAWFPSGDVVAIIDRTQQMNRQLDRPLALQFLRQPITRILNQLSESADLPITLAPDALNALSLDARENVSLIAQGVTTRQALNQLATATGLTWTLQETGVHVSAGQTLKATPKPAPTDPIVATITVPLPNGTQIQIPIHASECPPELMTYLETHKKKGLDVLLEQIKSEP